MNPLDAYFINQSQNPGKLTFVNALFWEKKGSYTQATSSFQFRLVNISTAHDVSWVSSLILRAKPWLTQKVLHHGNRSAARVRRRYFRGGGEGGGGERSDNQKCICCSQAKLWVGEGVKFSWRSDSYLPKFYKISISPTTSFKPKITSWIFPSLRADNPTHLLLDPPCFPWFA